jgi:hypothetical protein
MNNAEVLNDECIERDKELLVEHDTEIPAQI